MPTTLDLRVQRYAFSLENKNNSRYIFYFILLLVPLQNITRTMNVKHIFLLTALLLLFSCGSDTGKFRLEGRLRNMNQGEFWVYSPDGGMEGIDTIAVRNGRFAYELDLTGEATLVVIFPNYSEQPVFARPGKTVSIKGDATHLKEMIIQGTTDNEDMTKLRMELNDLTPPDIPNAVSTFIQEHPASLTSLYLLQRYFLLTPQPDYKQALKLTKLMLEESPDNQRLSKLAKQLAKLQGGQTNSRLPKFSATDINGQRVTESALKHAVNIVSTWATWSPQSITAQSQLKRLKSRYADRMGVVSICLDGRKADCQQQISRDSLKWHTICDGKMWDTPLLSTFGLADVPTNVLIDGKGRIIARNLSGQALEDRIATLLKPSEK